MPLTALSQLPEELPPSAHILVSVVRNEALRLPYFMSYYRSIGIDAFLFVDNGSNDGTCRYLLTQPNTFVFRTEDSFAASRWGMQWVNFLLDRFCSRHWILLADADEILVWPNSAHERLQDLTARLDAEGAEALFTLLLDMYSDKAFEQIDYAPGAPFIDFAPFFDKGPYKFVPVESVPYQQIYGGVRARVFSGLPGVTFHPPTVSKVPLVRWRKKQRFTLVAHALKDPVKLASMRGALLHFKMFGDVVEKCCVELARGEHYAKGREYWALGQAIEQSPTRSFFNEQVSMRYRDVNELTSLGLMDASKPY